MLGYRFLWVDRLCITQDDSNEALSKQLDQMADIFHCAALTLVDIAGNDANNGLDGVSYARDVSQLAFNCGDSFELATSMPWFQGLLQKSKRWTRG